MLKIPNNLKRYLVSLLLVSQLVVFASCTLLHMAQRPQEYDSASFHYEYGNSWGTHGEFWVWIENGVTYFEGSAVAPDMHVDVFAEADMEVFDSIAQIVADNRIDLWDGFSKSAHNVLDGHGFSLDIEYDPVSIHANGYMFEPENYQSGHEALLAFLCKYAEGLPVIIPSADSVGYIIVCTEELRYDLTLDMYDGVYSRVGSVNIRKKSADVSDERDFYKFSRTAGIPADKNESYVELNFEPAQSLRERSLEIVSSNGFPGKDVSEYVAVHYFGHKINGSHFCYSALSADEQHWFAEKMLSVVGLPADFDLSTLFNIAES